MFFLFSRISNETNVKLKETMYFGNDMSHIHEAERLGIESMLIEHGITMQHIMLGLYRFSNNNKIKDVKYL